MDRQPDAGGAEPAAVGIWVRLLSVPYRLLYPAIVLFCCIGVYTLRTTPSTCGWSCCLGTLGYLFAKIGCEPAPMLLGFILGPMIEEFFRRALVDPAGDFRVFIERPISAGLLAAAADFPRVDVAPSPRQVAAARRRRAGEG